MNHELFFDMIIVDKIIVWQILNGAEYGILRQGRVRVTSLGPFVYATW